MTGTTQKSLDNVTGTPDFCPSSIDALERRAAEAKRKLEELGVEEMGEWPKILNDAREEMKQVTEKMYALEEREVVLKQWFKDMKEMGTMPCIEPGKNLAALDSLAVVLGTFAILTKCLEDTEHNFKNIRKLARDCYKDMKEKYQLAEEVLSGVHGRRCDVEDEQLTIQPVPTIEGWVGDTACGTLQKMIEGKRSELQQGWQKANSNNTEGEHNDGGAGEDNGEGGA